MLMRPLIAFVHSRVPALIASLLLAGSTAVGGDGGRALDLEPSNRISVEPPPVATPPAVPAQADAVQPTTFRVSTTWRSPGGDERSAKQTVMRTADRVRVAHEQGPEWLFERNPVDPRRVSGQLIEHSSQRIPQYSDTDLRNRLRLRGWLDVLTMSFDPAELGMLYPTGERRTVGGSELRQYVRAEDAAGKVVEVWWSGRLLVPLLLVVREGGVVSTAAIEGFDSGRRRSWRIRS